MMLANAVIVPLYADPLAWTLAGVAMWAEIGTEVRLLRRSGRAAGAMRPLLLINLMTWLSFLIAVDWLPRRSLTDVHWIAWIGGLEALVVIVEALLMWATVARAPGAARRPLGLGQAFVVSLVGNLVSIVASVVLPAFFFWGLQTAFRLAS